MTPTPHKTDLKLVPRSTVVRAYHTHGGVGVTRGWAIVSLVVGQGVGINACNLHAEKSNSRMRKKIDT